MPLEPLLRSVASNNLVLVRSGGSDWIAGSGKAERVEGGWRITARKIFASGVPVGDVLVTSAVWDNPESGPIVLHFPLPLKGGGVKVLNTWRVLGMRGTGSHDIVIDGAFVPDARSSCAVPRASGICYFTSSPFSLFRSSIQSASASRRRRETSLSNVPAVAATGRIFLTSLERRTTSWRRRAYREVRNAPSRRHGGARHPRNQFSGESHGSGRRRGLLSRFGARGRFRDVQAPASIHSRKRRSFVIRVGWHSGRHR